jgi:hypothetical protein
LASPHNTQRGQALLSYSMDWTALENTRAATERHLAEAEHQVANQRELVAALERDGQADQPTKVLAQFEEVLAMYIADRDRLRKNSRTRFPQRSIDRWCGRSRRQTSDVGRVSFIQLRCGEPHRRPD